METLCRGSPSERLVAKRLNPQTNRQQYRLTDLGREYGIASSASSLGRDEDDESDLEEIRSKRRNRLPSQSRRQQDGTATHRPGRPVSGAPAPPRPGKRRDATVAASQGRSGAPAPPRPGKRPRLASDATVAASQGRELHGREYDIASSASSLGRDEDDESDLEEIRSKRRNRLPSQSRRQQDGTATHRPGRPVSGAPAPPRPGKRPRLASEATVTALPDTSTGYLAALVQRTPVRTDVKEEEAIQVTVRKIATVSTLETATATENGPTVLVPAFKLLVRDSHGDRDRDRTAGHGDSSS